MDKLTVVSSNSKASKASVEPNSALETSTKQKKLKSSPKSLKISKTSRKKSSVKEKLPEVRKTRSNSKGLNEVKSSIQVKSTVEVVKANEVIPRKIEVVKAKKSPNVAATPEIKSVQTPKSTKSNAVKTPRTKSVKDKTPKSSRKKALDTTVEGSTKKLSKKLKSPITKTLQSVTESLIMKNQFQMDTPTKFKIYRSKNEGDEVKDETGKDFSILSPSPKKVLRPRVELPDKYLSSSNVSFDDGKEFLKIFKIE